MKQSTQWMINFAKIIKPNAYLEIGVKHGQTIFEIEKYSTFCFGVDVYIDNFILKNRENTYFIEISSDEFFKNYKVLMEDKFSIQKFDMIFIDGLHEKEQAKKDFFNSLTVLSDNGYIFLHDTEPPDERHLQSTLCGNVWEFIQSLKIMLNRDKYEIFHLPCQYGLTVVRNKNLGLDWMK